MGTIRPTSATANAKPHDRKSKDHAKHGHALLLSLTVFTRRTVKPQIYRGLLNGHTYTL